MEEVIYSKSEDRAFTEKETAQYLQISTSTLRQARMNGPRLGKFSGPPFVKLGRVVRYLKPDLDLWLQSHKVSHPNINSF